MAESWLSFRRAADLIRDRLNSSVGRAEAIFRAALASGEVRSRPGPVLLAADDGLIDFNLRGEALSADGKSAIRHFIDGDVISQEDLLDWLDRQQHQADKRLPTQERQPGGKQPRLRQYLKDRFGDEPVPEPGVCPRKQLINAANAADPTLKPLDEATMKKAIDDHNARIAKAGS